MIHPWVTLRSSRRDDSVFLPSSDDSRASLRSVVESIPSGVCLSRWKPIVEWPSGRLKFDADCIVSTSVKSPEGVL